MDQLNALKDCNLGTCTNAFKCQVEGAILELLSTAARYADKASIMLSLPKYTVTSAFAATLVTYHAFSTREQ